MMSSYFSQQVGTHPEQFYQFLLSLSQELSKKSDQESLQIAHNYLRVVEPLCERFGFIRQRDILNDLSFSLTSPEQYKSITTRLQKYKKTSEKIKQQIFDILANLLDKHEFSFSVVGRYKSTYSIFQKMKRKKRDDVFQLKDIFGFRIIVENNITSQCFEIANLLHDTFTPLPRRFKDYISIPKTNGYQSLHIGIHDILSQLDIPVEIQICTRSMEEVAEKGLAAHWMYSENKTIHMSQREQTAIRQLFEHRERYTPSRMVYCFSYRGDIFRFEIGATLNDFAHSIHSHLKDRAKYALVNSAKTPLTTTIQSGDVIQIIT